MISEWTFRAQLCIWGKFCSLHTPLCSIFSFESSKLILNRPLNLDIESRIDIAISKFAQNWEQILSFQENYKTFSSTFLFNVENLIFLGTSKSSFNYAVYLYLCISLFCVCRKYQTIDYSFSFSICVLTMAVTLPAVGMKNLSMSNTVTSSPWLVPNCTWYEGMKGLWIKSAIIHLECDDLWLALLAGDLDNTGQVAGRGRHGGARPEYSNRCNM